MTRYLVDTSVLARARQSRVRAELGQMSDRGVLAACAVTEMELLYSARHPGDRDRIRSWLRAFEWLPTPDDIWERAIAVQGELIERGYHRGVAIPDLVLAATAERYRRTVLHYDRDFDRIVGVTGQAARWVVPAGKADV